MPEDVAERKGPRQNTQKVRLPETKRSAMRHDPLYICWLVRCEPASDAQRLREWLPDQVRPDRTVSEWIRAFPEGEKSLAAGAVRIAYYFDSICLHPGLPEDPATFRIVFRRRPDASRFWKDIMARILQEIRNRSPQTTTTMEYRGDDEPAIVSASMEG